MKRRMVLCAWAALAAAAPQGLGQEAAPDEAAQEEERERVELRVVRNQQRGVVVVDRGEGAGVRLGDRVIFYPRQGGTYVGTVIQTTDRSASVELLANGVELEPGTRGEVRVLRAAPDPEDEPAVPKTVEGVPEHPPWEAEDEWQPGLPLLAETGMRPEQRALQVSGRTYFIGTHIFTTDEDRTDTFLRPGVDLLLENPFGRGGGMNIDGELNYRSTELPDAPDEDDTRARFDRLSYYEGGTRFGQRRWEAGRFLTYGMPEFGVVDGFEYSKRLDNGDRWGATIGRKAQLVDEYEEGDDLQIAAYYSWMISERNQFVVDAGIQRVMGDTDRDLLVAKMRYLPAGKWNYQATTWIDVYDSDDNAKGSGVELTQAIAMATRQWESGNGMNVTLSRISFPDVGSQEFANLLPEVVAESETDRLSVHGWRWLEDGKRFHGRFGIWADEDDSGLDGEVALDFPDLWAEASRTTVAFFNGLGKFNDVLGTRLSYALPVSTGEWGFMYELATHHFEDFQVDADDMLQHRLRISRDYHSQSGWDWSVFTEGSTWDDDNGVVLGVFLQKSF